MPFGVEQRHIRHIFLKKTNLRPTYSQFLPEIKRDMVSSIANNNNLILLIKDHLLNGAGVDHFVAHFKIIILKSLPVDSKEMNVILDANYHDDGI